MKIRRLWAAVAVTFAAGQLSCAAPPKDESKPEVKYDIMQAQVSLKVEGAVDLDLNRVVVLKRSRFDDKRLPDVTAFGIEPTDWINLGDGRQVWMGLGLSPFDGDRKYTIEAPGQSNASVSSVSSASIRIRDGGNETRFELPKTPCKVTIASGGGEGELVCSQIRGVDGFISVDWNWQHSA